MTTYTCGTCGRKGHNRRSCRNSPNTPPTPLTRPSTKKPTTLPAENITIEEIQTWWALTNEGKTGKQKIVTQTFKTWSWNRKKSDWKTEDTEKLFNMLTLAVKEGASEKTLKKFLNLFGADAKKEIASQPDLPPTLHIILARDTNVGVKHALIRKGDLPDTVGKILANDKNYHVREKLAQRSTLPTVLIELYKTKDNLPRPYDETYWRTKIGHSEGNLENALAKNPHLPPDLHKLFLHSTHFITMESALSNPQTSPKELYRAWNNPNVKDSTKRVILGHKSTPVHVIEEQTRKLCQHTHPTQVEMSNLGQISNNPSTPIPELLLIIETMESPTAFKGFDKDFILSLARTNLKKR